MTLIIYKLALSDLIPGEGTVRRALTVSINGGEPVTTDVNAGDLVEYPEGSTVRAFLIDYDAANNGSIPSPTSEFVASAPDTTGPSQPTLGFEFMGVKVVEDPAPTE